MWEIGQRKLGNWVRKAGKLDNGNCWALSAAVGFIIIYSAVSCVETNVTARDDYGRFSQALANSTNAAGQREHINFVVQAYSKHERVTASVTGFQDHSLGSMAHPKLHGLSPIGRKFSSASSLSL